MNYEKIIKSIRYNGLLDTPDDSIYAKAHKVIDKAKYMINKAYLKSMPYKPTPEQKQDIQLRIDKLEKQKYKIINKPLSSYTRTMRKGDMDRETAKLQAINAKLLFLYDMMIGKIPFAM